MFVLVNKGTVIRVRSGSALVASLGSRLFASVTGRGGEAVKWVAYVLAMMTGTFASGCASRYAIANAVWGWKSQAPENPVLYVCKDGTGIVVQALE